MTAIQMLLLQTESKQQHRITSLGVTLLGRKGPQSAAEFYWIDTQLPLNISSPSLTTTNIPKIVGHGKESQWSLILKENEKINYQV